MNTDIAPDPEDNPPGQPAPEIAAADKAGAPHIFRALPLEPFSVRRQLAAQAMGNKLISGRVTLPAGGAYDGMFADVAVLLYLCSKPISVSHRAVRRPDEVLDAALEWAEKEGISVGSLAFLEAFEVYATIMTELHEAQFAVTEHAGSEAPKNGAGGPATAALKNL